MNDQDRSKAEPSLPAQILRPKFWEVSADRSRAYVTPFEKYRVLEHLGLAGMADRMLMSPDEYEDMDQGHVRPGVADILRFCSALSLHPLDLYVEPYDGIPLPRELLEALLETGQSPQWRESMKERSRQRLCDEFVRADTMLGNNSDALQPLLIALGYVPEIRVFMAPFYDLDHPASAKLQCLMEGGEDHPHGLINAYLDAYQLALEENFSAHTEALRQINAQISKYAVTMPRAGKFLYGDGYETALERLRAALERADDPKTVKLKLMNNPAMLWDMTAESLNGMPVPKNQRLGRTSVASLFFAAVQGDRELAAPRRELWRDLSSSYDAVSAFSSWRNLPRTRRLLDWFENWLILDNYFDGNHSPVRHLIRDRIPKAGLNFLK